MNNSDFAGLGLGKDTLRSVAEAGYTEPTPIQKEAIPFVLMGRDLLGCAQTGTGKTAGFTLPMLDILSSGAAKARMPRALVLEPTRELATQVAEAFEVYGKYHELSTTLLIGGVSIDKQEQALERNQDVLIATPGRLLDLFERGRVLLSGVKMLVIDEADRMLDMGFIPDVERIVRLLPKIRQTLFFSATIPGEVRRLADSFLMNPKEIYVDPSATAAVTVDHGLAIVDERDKREALRRLIRSEDVKNALIFCNRKRDVDVLYRSLKRHAFDVNALHGDMAQAVRTETLQAFRDDEVRLLVASDVAARGLDIVGLSHVFNFDVPDNPEDYVHRIGRTGRAGSRGRTLMIATADDGKAVAAIERLIGLKLPRLDIQGLETGSISDNHDGARRRKRVQSTARTKTKPERVTPPADGSSRGQTRKKTDGGNVPTPANGSQSRKQSSRKRAERDDGKRSKADGSRRDKNEPVVGMGDHTPAFLLRSNRAGR